MSNKTIVLIVFVIGCVSSACADGTWSRHMEMQMKRLEERTFKKDTRAVDGLAGCSKLTCGNVGSRCVGNVVCLGNTFCADDTMDYPRDNSTCQTYYPDGAYCNGSAIYSGDRCQNTCNTTTNTCGPSSNQFPKDEGQPCSSDSQCYSSYCPSSSKVCSYINLGGNCTGYRYSCKTGYCNSSNICTAPGNLGDSCAKYGYCVSPLDCIPYNITTSCSGTPPFQTCNNITVNRCAQLFTVPFGGLCFTSENCVAGSVCTGSSFDYGYCTPAPSNSSLTSCSSSSDCYSPSEYCVCNDLTGNGQCTLYSPSYTSSYVSAVQEYNNCVYTICADDPTCINNKCSTQVCPYILNQYNNLVANNPTCYIQDRIQYYRLIYPACFSGGSTIGVSVWVLVAGIIAFLVM